MNGANGNGLPEGWALARMGDVAKVVGGSTPKAKEPRFWGGEIPWLAVSDLTGHTDKFISGGARSITHEGYESCPTQLLPAGSIVFSSRAPIGYIAITTRELCTSQGFKSFVPSPELSVDYLYWYLRSAVPVAVSLASGTTFPEISGRVAAEIPVPIAPRAEQDRIVEVIESRMGEITSGLDSLGRARKTVSDYQASILAATVTGRISSDHSEETADAVVARALEERRDTWEKGQLEAFEAQGKTPPSDGRWEGRYKEPLAPNPPVGVTLPKGWRWATVDQLATRVQYGSSFKTTEDDAGVAVLRMGNIFSGQLRIDSLKYLPVDHPEFPELLLHHGDVLFNRTNSPELVGKAAVYRGEVSPCSFASYLIRVRLSDAYRPELLVYFLTSALGRAWVKQVVSQQVGQANVNGTKLRQLTVPVPPKSVQDEICGVAEQQLRTVAETNATIAAVHDQGDRLRQSLLASAFSGRLTSRDPLDGSGLSLMEKVRKGEPASKENRAQPKSHAKTSS